MDLTSTSFLISFVRTIMVLFGDGVLLTIILTQINYKLVGVWIKIELNFRQRREKEGGRKINCFVTVSVFYSFVSLLINPRINLHRKGPLCIDHILALFYFTVNISHPHLDWKRNIQHGTKIIVHEFLGSKNK